MSFSLRYISQRHGDKSDDTFGSILLNAPMTITDFATFRKLAEHGQISVGVEPAVARRLYTEASDSWIREKVGESVAAERLIVKGAFVAAPVALLISFGLLVRAFGWVSIILIPITGLVWYYHGGRASMGSPRLWWMTILTMVLIFTAIDEPTPLSEWGVVFILALYLDRIKYRAAVLFFRALIIRNQRAFELFADAITYREVVRR
jgi:hypothetical protein